MRREAGESWRVTVIALALFGMACADPRDDYCSSVGSIERAPSLPAELRRAAQRGYAPAMNATGVWQAKARDGDRELAEDWFAHAIEADEDACAMVNLAELPAWSSPDGRPDLALLERAAAAEPIDCAVAAMKNLALCYLNGYGAGTDEAAAVQWFQRAAEHDDAQALYALGLFHLDGLGDLPQSDTEAESLLRRSFDAGHGDAGYWLAFMMREGRARRPDGSKVDRREVDALVREADARGSGNAEDAVIDQISRSAAAQRRWHRSREEDRRWVHQQQEQAGMLLPYREVPYPTEPAIAVRRGEWELRRSFGIVSTADCAPAVGDE